MAIRDIVLDSDPQLRKISREVTSFDFKLAKLLDDMYETMVDADGVGLAAPQVGILRRLAVVEVDDLFLELINPIIIRKSGSQIDYEGCLSVHNRKCYVDRPMYITIEFSDRYGKRHTLDLEDLPARACCHELDHLDGVLFYDNEYKGTVNK